MLGREADRGSCADPLLRQQYKLTKVITLYPRFIVKNNFSTDIRVRELGSTKEVTLAAGDRHALEFLRAGHEPQLVLSSAGGPSNWYVVADTVVLAFVDLDSFSTQVIAVQDQRHWAEPRPRADIWRRGASDQD